MKEGRLGHGLSLIRQRHFGAADQRIAVPLTVAGRRFLLAAPLALAIFVPIVVGVRLAVVVLVRELHNMRVQRLAAMIVDQHASTGTSVQEQRWRARQQQQEAQTGPDSAAEFRGKRDGLGTPHWICMIAVRKERVQTASVNSATLACFLGMGRAAAGRAVGAAGGYAAGRFGLGLSFDAEG